MVQAALLGQHSHTTTTGSEVHVWMRDGKFIARGRYQGKAFGETLGSQSQDAAARLRRLLVEIEDGTFVRSTERSRRPLRRGQPPRLDLRTLCDCFLNDKRRTLGKRTTQDYTSRLGHLIAFAERPNVKQQWPSAQDTDREFVVELRAFLHERQVTPNGRAAATPQRMAPGQVFNVLDCARTCFAWAQAPTVNLLPSWLANPFTVDLVGRRPAKDPLRQVAFPLKVRIALVQAMDRWQLLHLSWRLVLPLRPEDFSGLLISDIDVERRYFRFGPRVGGADFNKGQQTFRCPYPRELDFLLTCCVTGRAAGPLLRQRQVFERRRLANEEPVSPRDEMRLLESALATQAPGEVLTPQDGKRVVRGAILRMGGLSVDAQHKELKKLLAAAGDSLDGNTYQLRESINTEMEAAGVSHLVQRYVTGHHTSDIQNHYVSLDPTGQMRKYFDAIELLLRAIRGRAKELGVELGSRDQVV